MSRDLGTRTTIDGLLALRFVRHFDHSIDRVWRAVTEPAELAQWFVGPVSWTPRLGETFEVMGQTITITALDEPRLLAWRWGEERYEMALRGDASQCELTFTHVFDGSFGPAAQHAAGWDAYLLRLTSLLDGAPLDELAAHRSIGEQHERYALAFDEDPTPGRRMIAGMAFRDLTLEDGPILRLERFYEHPPERVWRALTDPAELARWFPAGEPLQVVESTEPTSLTGTWFGEQLRFELRPIDGGCLLIFTHAFDDGAVSARTAAGWDRCFARFDALLAGAELGEQESLELWLEVHDRYAETFGVDPAVGHAAYEAATS